VPGDTVHKGSLRGLTSRSTGVDECCPDAVGPVAGAAAGCASCRAGEFHVKQRPPGILRLPHAVRARVWPDRPHVAEVAPVPGRHPRRLQLPREATPMPSEGLWVSVAVRRDGPWRRCVRTTGRPPQRGAGSLIAPGAQTARASGRQPGIPGASWPGAAAQRPARAGSFVQDCPSAYTPQVVSPPGLAFPAGAPPGQPQDRPQWVPYSPRSALQ
jgi:hypothetical protein